MIHINEIERMRLELEVGKEPSKIQIAKRNISLLYKNAKRKLKETKAVIKGEKLKNNKEYVGASKVSQYEVEKNPAKWIIEECIPACKILWDKNIYTFMCSDQEDKYAWIELKLENLSEENLKILETIKQRYETYKYHYGCINIQVNGKGKKAQKELIEMANMFKMQDVPSNEATITFDEILVELGLYKEVPNPNYEQESASWENNVKANGWGYPLPERTFLVADKSQMVKPPEDYINEYGAIEEDGIIYKSHYHYKKHLKYIHNKEENIINKK